MPLRGGQETSRLGLQGHYVREDHRTRPESPPTCRWWGRVPTWPTTSRACTHISALPDRGVDLATAADLAGHASPNTTKRYDRRGERARHAAAEVVVVPYAGPSA